MIDPQAVNIQTVAFIGFLNELARGSKDGIHPFSTATKQSVKGLLYDDKNPIKVFTDGDFSQTSYPLVADYLIDECHDDIISTWTEMWAEIGIQVVVTVDHFRYVSGVFVDITSKNDDEFSIVIHDGIWYNC